MYEITDKSTPEEIRDRFDADVERFSNLETGQVAAMDSPLHMDLLTRAATGVTPGFRSVLDIGCGAGNYTLKLLQLMPDPAAVSVTLVDLSSNMLKRAEQRLREVGVTRIQCVCGDVRDAELGEASIDIAMAAQCLHHLRGDEEWEAVFAAIYRSLRGGGSFWISDSVEYHHAAVREMVWQRWGVYLEGLAGREYRDKVFTYVGEEDTPRPLWYQLDLMRRVGFRGLDVLHVAGRFASFGGCRPRE